MKFATVSHSIYLLETQFPVLLRTVAKLQPLIARQRKAKRGVLKSAAANHVVYLLETKFRATL
ncbi:hypothetical protein SAMN02745116_01290 [Pilibacter termitis]|uniref:Uncharacterized protein n=1 Tax=Pilibacter termitis TaxID=263852 RepID=A0A1T4N1S8_9ENTE|nr:hypothetical protein [Pilibacter termitis]SJZ73162.1 hypothetical protein SAMN02745116_01290 [Pilibacter termitis]